MAFRSTGKPKNFQKRITQLGIVEEDLSWSGGGGILIFKKTLTTICQWSTKSSRQWEDAKRFISRTRRASSIWKRIDFQQDNTAIHNASITKKYLLEKKKKKKKKEKKKRPLDHLTCSPDLNPMENLWGLIVVKVYEGGRQYSAISELKNAIIDAWENTIGSTSETSW